MLLKRLLIIIDDINVQFLKKKWGRINKDVVVVKTLKNGEFSLILSLVLVGEVDGQHFN